MAEPADEMTIKLRKPITLGGEVYREVTLREPTAAEMMQWEKLEGTEGDIKAVAIVSGIPEAAVRLMGARDLLKGARFIGGFLV